jgi:hypothetical protein
MAHVTAELPSRQRPAVTGRDRRTGGSTRRWNKHRAWYAERLPLPCLYCQAMVWPEDRWHLSHRRPRAYGGTDADSWPALALLVLVAGVCRAYRRDTPRDAPEATPSRTPRPSPSPTARPRSTSAPELVEASVGVWNMFQLEPAVSGVRRMEARAWYPVPDDVPFWSWGGYAAHHRSC